MCLDFWNLSLFSDWWIQHRKTKNKGLGNSYIAWCWVSTSTDYSLSFETFWGCSCRVRDIPSMHINGSIASCPSLSTAWCREVPISGRPLFESTAEIVAQHYRGAGGIDSRGTQRWWPWCRGEAGLPRRVLPPEAGSLGSPTTSMPAISIARRPTILHRWGYGWICLDFSIWCSTSDFSSCLFGTALLYSINLYNVWYCRCVFVATLQRWWSNINCACSNSQNLEPWTGRHHLGVVGCQVLADASVQMPHVHGQPPIAPQCFQNFRYYWAFDAYLIRALGH